MISFNKCCLVLPSNVDVYIRPFMCTYGVTVIAGEFECFAAGAPQKHLKCHKFTDDHVNRNDDCCGHSFSRCCLVKISCGRLQTTFGSSSFLFSFPSI